MVKTLEGDSVRVPVPQFRDVPHDKNRILKGRVRRDLNDKIDGVTEQRGNGHEKRE